MPFMIALRMAAAGGLRSINVPIEERPNGALNFDE